MLLNAVEFGEALRSTNVNMVTVQQTATQLVFGVLALAAVATLGARHRWTRSVLVLWGSVLSISAGFATVVWGGQGGLPAAAATVATILIAWLTRWALQPALTISPV